MKRKQANYCQVFNNAVELLNKHNHKIPYSTRWLYIHLNLLEHRYTGRKEDFFFRSIEDLHKDTGIGTKQVVGGLKALQEMGLIHKWKMHWADKETGKKSEKYITAIRMLEV